MRCYTTYRCLALKFKVHDLLDRKVISFTTKNSNVKNNPMPRHDGPNINVVEKLEDSVLIQRVDQIKTPMYRIFERLIGYEVFE